MFPITWLLPLLRCSWVFYSRVTLTLIVTLTDTRWRYRHKVCMKLLIARPVRTQFLNEKRRFFVSYFRLKRQKMCTGNNKSSRSVVNWVLRTLLFCGHQYVIGCVSKIVRDFSEAFERFGAISVRTIYLEAYSSCSIIEFSPLKRKLL